jgi:hypothetical protein
VPRRLKGFSDVFAVGGGGEVPHGEVSMLERVVALFELKAPFYCLRARLASQQKEQLRHGPAHARRSSTARAG